MPRHQDSIATGDSTYARLLARFRGQPVGKKPALLPAKEAAAPARQHTRPKPAVMPVMPPELSQQAVTQLRAIWTGFMAGSPGFGAPREAGNVDGLDCRETFLQWRDACRAQAFSPLMCVEIVCLGMMDGDSRYRMMSGTAAAQAVHCLDIYCRQRGW